jgi:hypothetical protein
MDIPETLTTQSTKQRQKMQIKSKQTKQAKESKQTNNKNTKCNTQKIYRKFRIDEEQRTPKNNDNKKRVNRVPRAG